jgi:hypothetical protein
MASFYYPLSAKDYTFENIFASESVSPPFFYKERGFGIGYFNVIANINQNSAIILYSKPPKFNVENGIKFILQIEENSLDTNELIFIQEGIMAYQKTIYLTKENFCIYFFSERDKRITLLRSETSLPTKSLEKYLDNFKILSEEDCESYNLKMIDLSTNRVDFNNHILEDKKYNQFKGFVYGLATGLYSKKSSEEIFFKKLLREITNSFAELKSRTVDTKFSYSKLNYKKKENDDNSLYANRLLDVVKLAEQTYLDFFVDTSFNDDDLAMFLQKKSTRINSLSEAKNFINHIQIEDEFLDSKKYDELKKKYLSQLSSSSENSPLQKLKNQIVQFVDSAIYNSKSKVDLNKLNNDIKDTLYELDKHVIKLNQNHKNLQSFSLSGLNYNIQKDEISISSNFQGLNDREIQDMVLITNVILRFSEKSKSPLQKETTLQIVKHVGGIFSKDGKETLLYQYLNNEVDSYQFEKVSNSVMKNFVAFVFNNESLEKLENFINTKNVEKDWIAYSFWGAFNGFANLSGNFTKSIFNRGGEDMQHYLDQFLSRYIQELNKDNTELSKNESISQIESLHSQDSDKMELIDKFYQLYVVENYRITLEQFAELISIADKDIFFIELKKRVKVGKKASDILFNTIKSNYNSPLLL